MKTAFPHASPPASAAPDPARAGEVLLAEAHGRPWLLRVLQQRSVALYLRFQAAYQRLSHLRPGQLRRLQRKLGLGLAAPTNNISLDAGTLIPNGDSPAIDAGNPAAPGGAAPACFAADKRGQARDDLRCDMGAFEVKLNDHSTISKAVGGAGTFTFGPTLAKIVVNNQGSALAANAATSPNAALTSLSVQQVDSDHPNSAIANLQTGHYWTIMPSSGAGGYNLDLTLPALDFTPDGDDKLCRYTGSGWDCAASSFDGSGQTITRDGVTQLSDWTAGNYVGPNAVNLRGFSASGGAGGLGALWAGLVALLAGLGLGLRWRLGRGQRAEVGDQRLEVVEFAEARPDSEPIRLNGRSDPTYSAYQPPAVIHSGALKQLVGSAPEPNVLFDIHGD